MSLTSLDVKSALVVIDLQKGILARPAVHPVPEILVNAVSLVQAFRVRSLPVVLVRADFSADGGDMLQPRTDLPGIARPPAGWAELAEELAEAPNDILITKRSWSAFYGTELDLQLRRRGVTGIVLAGISTSIGVESTARDAYHHGYNVTCAEDAMTDSDADAHANSVRRIFPRLAEVGTTADILACL